jgi:hypothetical protein
VFYVVACELYTSSGCAQVWEQLCSPGGVVGYPIFFFFFLKKNLGLNDVKIGPERHVKKGGPERRGPE